MVTSFEQAMKVKEKIDLKTFNTNITTAVLRAHETGEHYVACVYWTLGEGMALENAIEDLAGRAETDVIDGVQIFKAVGTEKMVKKMNKDDISLSQD